MVKVLEGKNVLATDCGQFHTMALLDDGSVWSWGGTLHGKLGSPNPAPSILPSLSKHQIKQIGCGEFYSAALTIYGGLFTWGGGGKHKNRGALGHGHLEDIEAPELVTFFNKNPIREFSCGAAHMMAICENGELYSWGDNNYGQLGTGDETDSAFPLNVTVQVNEKFEPHMDDYEFFRQDLQVEKVDCGNRHSIFLTDNGWVFTCGNNSYGQTGQKKNKNLDVPTLVYSLHKKSVIRVAAGWNHSVVLTDTHDVYTTG